MQTGLGAVAAAIERASTRGSGSGMPTGLPYFGWRDDDKGGKSRVLRFLTDDVIVCKFYEYIVCNDGKVRDFIFGPSLDRDLEDYVMSFGAKMKPQRGQGLVDPVTREMTAGVAVLRKEIRDPERPGKMKVIDYSEKRKVREAVRDDKGTVIEGQFKEVELDSRWFGIVKQGNKNFWPNMVAYHQRYGTICDRDYEITRHGNDSNTTYSMIPLDIDPDLDTVEKVHQFYGYGKERDQSSPDRMLMCPITLKAWAYNLAGEARAKRFLGELKGEESSTAETSATTAATGTSSEAAPSSSNGNDEYHPETTSNPDPVKSAEVAEGEGFSAMKARLMANKG